MHLVRSPLAGRKRRRCSTEGGARLGATLLPLSSEVDPWNASWGGLPDSTRDGAVVLSVLGLIEIGVGWYRWSVWNLGSVSESVIGRVSR
jgi:hypothetical protein